MTIICERMCKVRSYLTLILKTPLNAKISTVFSSQYFAESGKKIRGFETNNLLNSIFVMF